MMGNITKVLMSFIVKALEAQWRENRELQGLVKAGMTHLAQCSKPSMCKMCSRVRESSFKNGLSVANGSATHKEASSVTDSRRRQASLLRGQYQRLCHVIGTLLPAPMATFDPGLDEPLGDDSGFVFGRKRVVLLLLQYISTCSTAAEACHARIILVYSSLMASEALKMPLCVKTSVGNGTTLGLSTSSPDTPKNGALANKRSAFLRMSRLTKSFGHSEKDKFRDPAAVVRRQLTIEDALEEAEVEPPIHDLAKHKKRSVRSFFNRMSIR
ncbi:unnamed protein product [Notodromas monacha]|uniref:Uncharacterized protein n=1 Tax=Notodromas monacha TaxID=399045 RepID=A0A7R9BN63_9CRUS|nr:unnamed protein product [Notodromas monacha]CAG0917204.1 unnamed protein product [Notodromas monacha]